MFKLNNNYTHRFIDSKKIYSITNNINSKIFYKNFLSVPYKSDSCNIDTNVLIGFNNEKYTNDYLEHANIYFKNEAELFKIDLDEFKYIGSLMNIPIVVIINKEYNIYNDEYDIYYHYKDKYEIMRSFNEKKL
jgi:hypothetical protein